MGIFKLIEKKEIISVQLCVIFVKLCVTLSAHVRRVTQSFTKITQSCTEIPINIKFHYCLWINRHFTANTPLVDYIEGNFDFVRLYAGVFEHNKASMRVLEKNWFHLESIQKNAVIKNGILQNEYIWVKLI